jgi:PAS domain S-box-containing protein
MSLEAHLIESMTDIVFAKDLNGRYILDELTGLTDLDLFPADLAGSFRANDQAMLASGQAQSNEEWVTYPDGRRALLETVKTSLRDASGTVIGLVGVCREIACPR